MHPRLYRELEVRIFLRLQSRLHRLSQAFGSRYGAPTKALSKAAFDACHSRKCRTSAFGSNERSTIAKVPEFRSTKCCHCCGSVLQQIRGVPGLRKLMSRILEAEFRGEEVPESFTKWKIVRGLVRCVNPSCAVSGRFMHRDKQAALSIREITIALALFGKIPFPFNPTMAKTEVRPVEHLLPMYGD